RTAASLQRPGTPVLLELHVLFVPADQWNVKLNKVPAEATESFISAGFIRVYPDVTLKTLRSELGALLGAQRSVNKFSFLKCVGRSLALVSAAGCLVLFCRQATQPELYLLPAVENDSSVCSRSLTPDTTSTSPDHQIYYHPPKTCSRATGTKEPTKFPHIPQYSHQPPPTHRLEEEEEEGDDRSYSSSEGGGEKEGETLSSIRRAEQECFRGQKQRAPQLALHTPQLQGEELISEIKLVQEERKQLERTRQELLRKGKDLLAQNRHRRNQARDSWKKKYFEAKKATAPLDENLRNLRQELETFYNKVLHQLQARDNRAKPRHQGRSSMKNELIIQIMTESHEIDNLKRKVEDGKMKLVTEIKLRKQAATELRALKAELAQKKSQSSHPGLMGNTPRHGAQVQT
uniref:Spermatosis associated 1 n=1 Tax=Maylandia zebra TaxID=106582 RepID=A0A3P9ASY4_9CICH